MHDNRIRQSYSRDDNQLRVVAELQRSVCVCVCFIEWKKSRNSRSVSDLMLGANNVL